MRACLVDIKVGISDSKMPKIVHTSLLIASLGRLWFWNVFAFLRVMPKKTRACTMAMGEYQFWNSDLGFYPRLLAELKSFGFSMSMHPQMLVPTLVHIPKHRGFWRGEYSLLTVNVSKPFKGRENNEEKIATSNSVISVEGQSLTYSATWTHLRSDD
jgi:hypothetical protein